MVRRTLTLLLFVCVIVLLSAAKEKDKVLTEGSITGVVVTEYGKLAPDFKVCIQLHSSAGWLDKTETRCPATTNGEGQFTIDNLRLGTYEIVAINEMEGYSLENQTPGKNVTIKAKNPHQKVVLQLRPKGSVLDALITDKVTGKVIHDAQLGYEGLDCEAGGGTYRDQAGHYYLPVVTDCDVVVTVRARGYKGWIYTDITDPSRPALKLSGLQRKELNVQLEPLPK